MAILLDGYAQSAEECMDQMSMSVHIVMVDLLYLIYTFSTKKGNGLVPFPYFLWKKLYGFYVKII